MNVISDIAGQYKALMALLKRMPDQETLSVGDMIDRGPDSKKVVDWFMNHSQTLLGNHEDMMIDYVLRQGRYSPGIWQMNGGKTTLKSYEENKEELLKAAHWMQDLPLSWENGDFYVSHTFQLKKFRFSDYRESPNPRIWNRKNPDPEFTGKFQVAGHNAWMGLQFFGLPPYAMCIDTSASNQLCGVDLNTMKIYIQKHIK